MSLPEEQNHLKYKVPDGGWGWMIILGSTINMSLVSCLQVTYGVMFSSLYTDLGTSSTVIGIIFNTNCVLWYLMFLLVQPLTDKFGWRGLGMVSTFMTSLSLILSGLVTSTTQLMFSYSIMGGVFGGLTTGQVYTILPKFFDKHLGVANAFPMAGFSISQFIFPVLTPFLQQEYGFKGSMLILGGIVLHSVASSALYNPPEWHQIKSYGENNVESKGDNKYGNNDNAESKYKIHKKHSDENKNEIKQCHNNEDKNVEVIHRVINIVGSDENSLVKTISEDILFVFKGTFKNLAILKRPHALIISLGYGLFIIITINFYGLIPFLIVNAGHSLEVAGWIMSYGAIANVFARIASSVLSDFKWFKVPIGYVSGFIMSFIAMLGFTLSDNIMCLIVFSVMQGLGHGAHGGLFGIVTKELVGPELHSASVGASGVMVSIGFLTIGPFLGFIKDLTGSYSATLLFMTVLNALCVSLWVLMPFAKSYDLRRNKPTENSTDNHTDELHIKLIY